MDQVEAEDDAHPEAGRLGKGRFTSGTGERNPAPHAVGAAVTIGRGIVAAHKGATPILFSPDARILVAREVHENSGAVRCGWCAHGVTFWDVRAIEDEEELKGA